MDNPQEPKPEGDPPKQTFIGKLKAKRWTFKVKNNLTEYVTVEPLILFYMFQISVISLIEPYLFHKACVGLDHDAQFCDVITTNENTDKNYQICALSRRFNNIYCKGLKAKPDNIWCRTTIREYENDMTTVFVNPEDYRLCQVIEKVETKTTNGADSLIGLSAIIINFLVVMVVSIWSDKFSKRKMCLMMPTLGQLIISILNLHGALSTYLSFEFINTASEYIIALSGGMPLFLFGCFSYMNDDTIRQKLLFRFGVICLILTIYRYIPYLYDIVYEYYHDDASYINLIIINLLLNILCLFYVKVILNESKQKRTVNALGDDSGSVNNNTNGLTNGKGIKATKTKRKQLAKAFSLDVIWDYILIVFKKRIYNRRLIIIFFLAIVFIDKISPYDGRFKLTVNETEIDVIDMDGAIFIIISAMMLLVKISDVVIAILVIGLPTVGRILLVILNEFISATPSLDDMSTDFYSPLKRIAACSLLLAYVDRSESRIFLIVQAVASLPSVLIRIVYAIFPDRLETHHAINILNIINGFIHDEGIANLLEIVVIFVLPVIVFLGLGLLYKFVKNYERLKTADETTKSPWNFIMPDQQNSANTEENENSTDL